MFLELRNNCKVYDLTSEQEEVLKEYLTFDNPAYKNAKRYSKNRYITIPPYLYYYTMGKDNRGRFMTFPIGVDIEKLLKYKIDPVKHQGDGGLVGHSCPSVDYPDFLLELRGVQEEARQAYMSSHFSSRLFGGNKCLVSLPTGKGKTILAIKLAAELRTRALVLVHKDDLVEGWKKDIDLCFGGKVKPGIIKAKKREVGEHITIATVQTLSRMSEEELSKYTDQFGFVIQDECLTGDTLVVQDDGMVLPMKSCFDFTRVYGGEVSGQFSRKSEIYQLSCSHSILKGSSTHPTWCVRKKCSHKSYSIEDFEVRELSELKRGEYLIPVVMKIPHTEKYVMSKTLARFVACVMCDGHIDKGISNRVKLNVQKDRKFYYDTFKEGVYELGGEIKHSEDARGNVTFWTTSKNVKHYLTKVCKVPVGKKSHLLSICDFMYGVPLDSIKAFIETCFNCKGDLSVGNSCRISFNTCSESFAQSLSMILKKFGILASIQEIIRGNKKHHTIYRLSVCDEFFNMFMDTFTLIPRKMTDRRNIGCKNNNRFVGDYYLSDIKKVESLGYTDMVYDFEVSGSHSFIANGIYTHNCHHVGLNIFNIINQFNSTYKLGLSATPKRSDGLDFVFDLFFGGVCYEYKASKDDEDISNVEVRVIDSGFKYKPFVYKNEVFNLYDFKPEELPDKFKLLEELPYSSRPTIPFHTIDNQAVLSPKTKICVCKKVLEHYHQGHSCILMFNQKEHINSYYRYLSHFVPRDKIMLYYGDSKEKSSDMMERAEKKEVLITLATYAKATEGTNVKSWEVEFLVSSINDKKNTEQATGRIRRRKEGKLEPVIVYDVRYSECYSLRGHYNTRYEVYKELDYVVHDPKGVQKENSRKTLFSRGYTR